MQQWVPFEKGEYIVVEAFLTAPDHSAVTVEKANIEVFEDRTGLRRVRGTGMIRPMQLVALHEDHEALELILDLGGDFKYRVRKPEIHAGKVFAPDVSALMQFSLTSPWEKLIMDDYEVMKEKLNFL